MVSKTKQVAIKNCKKNTMYFFIMSDETIIYVTFWLLNEEINF
jgi:hypothetical protein